MTTQQPLIIETFYKAPVEKVWKALTDNDDMRQWYFALQEFKAEPGFEFTFEGGSDEEKYVHLCRITEVIPNKKLCYTWRYEGYEGLSHLCFELSPEDEGTRVKLTHEGLETFRQDKKDFTRESFTGGWNYIMGTSLKKFLEG